MPSKFHLFNYTVEREVSCPNDNDEIPENIHCISAPSQWPQGQGEDSIVGIIDTGCQIDHPSLKDAIADSKNFCKGSDATNANDENGHGTHVTGIVHAVSPKCKIVVAKALGRNGTGEVSEIIAALKWLTGWRNGDLRGVDVINMSIGIKDDVPALHRAIKTAVKRGITIVTAVGNDGDSLAHTSEIAYPAYYDEVISVAAVNNNGKPMGFSNTNIQVDVAAPGSKIKSTMIGSRWGLLSGSSMAAPHITGAVALIISRYVNRTTTRPSPEVISHFVRYFTNRNKSVGMDCFVGAGSFNFVGVLE